MQVVNKVLSKWNKKTELANHKISLNLQSDINKIIGELENAIGILESGNDDVAGAGRKARLAVEEFNEVSAEYKSNSNTAKSYITNAKKVKEKVENIAKDLGVDPNGVKNYKSIDVLMTDLLTHIKEAPSVIKEFGNFK
jgi:DNA repair ATPase RecN